MKQKKQKNAARYAIITVISAAAVTGLLFLAYQVYTSLLVGRLGKLDPDASGDVLPAETMEPGYTGVIIDDPVIINDQAKSAQEIAILGDTANLTNILLLGIDTGGKSGYKGLSDAIIILTVNRNPGRQSIKMTSLLRDVCVPVEGHGPQKLNAAYSYGGYTLLLDTLKKQFRLDISHVAAVNFEVYEKAVDSMDGVDIELTSEEARHMNIGKSAGSYHLNGAHALDYVRIRAIGNDWGRTGRQRTMLRAMMSRAGGMNPLALNSLLFDIFPQMQTNMTQRELKGYVDSVPGLLGYPVSQSFFPAIDTFEDPYINGVGRALVMNNQAETVRAIQHFIYD